MLLMDIKKNAIQLFITQFCHSLLLLHRRRHKREFLYNVDNVPKHSIIWKEVWQLKIISLIKVINTIKGTSTNSAYTIEVMETLRFNYIAFHFNQTTADIVNRTQIFNIK